MKNKPNLLHCPFCSSPAELIVRKKGEKNPFKLHKESKYAIACSSDISVCCYLYSGHEVRTKHDKHSWDDVLVWYAVLDDAVGDWNTRNGKR